MAGFKKLSELIEKENGCQLYLMALPEKLATFVDATAAEAANTVNAVMIEAVVTLSDSGRMPPSLKEVVEVAKRRGITVDENLVGLTEDLRRAVQKQRRMS